MNEWLDPTVDPDILSSVYRQVSQAPRALWWFQGEAQFLMSEVPLYKVP